MDDWKTVTLADISVGGKGSYGIPAPAIPYSEGNYTYLRITDINDDGTLNLSDRKSLDDPAAQEYLLQTNDIVFARTGNSTGRNYFYNPEDGDLVYAGFLIKFSINPEKVNPKYIKYYMLSPKYRAWITAFNTGSTRGNINAQTYANMQIDIPPRKQQDLLVDVLSSLDAKIRVNNQINRNLEEQAQAIFKSWFVDFEPFQDGEFVDTELGRIPQGWKFSSLSNIASFLNGLAMQKYRPEEDDPGLPVLKIKELHQGYCDTNSDRCSSEIPEQNIIHDGDVVFSWSGTLLVDFWCGGECGLNQHLFKVTSEKFDKCFYFLWISHHLAEFSAIAEGKATTMGHIKREHLDQAKVLLPSASDYNRLTSILKPLYDQMVLNRIESKKLALLRDTLLPKLMSGELKCNSYRN